MNGGGQWIMYSDGSTTAAAGDWTPIALYDALERWRPAFAGVAEAIEQLADRLGDILAPLVGYGIAARPKPRRWFAPDPPPASAMLFAAHIPGEVHIPPHPRTRAPPQRIPVP